MPTTCTHSVKFFDANIKCNAQEWHSHDCNRLLRSIKGSGWSVQIDHQTHQLEQGEMVFVPAGRFHRLVPGEGALVLEIIENCEVPEDYCETEPLNTKAE